ncbi:acyltransferase family protein [Streptomyces sp. NPDC006704]|uniref:acyltransferase family protein n=1 Tax=Streptomyces sp. NPDC006704 TaxID=3364760 RepID=UPI003680B6A8
MGIATSGGAAVLVDKEVSSGSVSESSAPRSRGRIYVLDGLRLLAALMVVVYHFVPREGAWSVDAKGLFPAIFTPAAYGWLGVHLFFLISGFVICMSCWGRTLGDFFTSRVIRLFPAYWFAVLTTTVVLTLTRGNGPRLPLSTVLTNLTMLQEPMGVDHVDGIYWTLFAEMRFYLLFAALAWWGLTYRRVLVFCWVWVVASAIVYHADDGILRMLVMPEYSWLFIGGMACYLMHRFGPNLLLTLLFLVCFGGVLPSLHMSWSRVPRYIGHQLPYWPALVLLALFFVIMALVATDRLSWIKWRWLPYAGALTYPLYLLHQEIGRKIIHGLEPHMSPYAVLGVTIAIMLLAAWLVHRLIERPLSKKLKRGLTQALSQVRSASA